MLKKITLIILDFISISLIIASYLFKHFTKRKLGMRRWINFKNGEFSQIPYFFMLKYILIILTIIIIFYMYKKYKEKIKTNKILLGMFIVLILFEIVFILTCFFMTEKISAAYNFIGLFLFLVLVIQIIKNYIILKTYEK